MSLLLKKMFRDNIYKHYHNYEDLLSETSISVQKTIYKIITIINQTEFEEEGMEHIAGSYPKFRYLISDEIYIKERKIAEVILTMYVRYLLEYSGYSVSIINKKVECDDIIEFSDTFETIEYSLIYLNLVIKDEMC